MTDPDPDDLEQEEKEAQRAQRKKMAYAFGGVMVVFVIGLGIAAKSCTGTRREANKLTLHAAVAKFENNPIDPDLAKAAAAELEAAGKKAEADKVRARHEAAVAGGDKGKEAQLRAALAADPSDDTSLGQLVEVYVKRKDLEGARKVYEEFVGKTPTAKRHSKFGAWLYRNSLNEPAAKELALAVKGGVDDAYTRGYLGMALSELGKKREAQKWLDEALEMGADLDVFRTRSWELDQELGERGAAPVKKPKKK
jgi:tetratricopeptide (TPR) repeat protein